MSDKLQKLTIRDLQEFREIESTDDKDFEEKVEVLRKKHGLTGQETAKVLGMAWKMLPSPSEWT